MSPVVAQRAAVPPRHALGLELRLQPHQRAGREPRVVVQEPVPRWRDAPVPRAALRVPRRWRVRGRASCSTGSSGTGTSATSTRSTHSTPTGSMSTRSWSGSSATATTPSPRTSTRSARTSRVRRRGPRSSTSSRACEIEQKADLRDLFEPHFYFGCEADDPLVRVGVPRRHQPARRTLAPDPRLRHLALGRARHDRAGRTRRTSSSRRATSASATSASSRSSTRRVSTPGQPRLLRRHRLRSGRRCGAPKIPRSEPRH